MIFLVGRLVYLGVVLVGVWVNYVECRRANWIAANLMAAKINGPRQLVAAQFVWSSRLLLAVQLLLCVPVLTSFLVPIQEFPRDAEEWARLAVLAAHVVMVGLLTALSISNRRQRERLIAAAAHD